MTSIVCNLPLNRVEGDLEIKVVLEDGVVTDAWSIGTMFRGFERFLIGRGALDGLVMTPRICGICSTTHLSAAAYALDQAAAVTPPPNALRHRNLALMVEQIQSDLRQSLLMFMVDFAAEAYTDQAWYAEAAQRYTPFKGSRVLEAVRETKNLLEVIAILGGQWPHSSYMVPGGIAFAPGVTDLMECRNIVIKHKRWFEQSVLGCTCERWCEISSRADLERWLEQDEKHRGGDVGWLIRLCRATGLDKIGSHFDTYLSYGSLPLPDGSGNLVPAGFYADGRVQPFAQSNIAEHVAFSWYENYPGGLHPAEGVTDPYASGSEGGKYSMAKAPRYAGRAAETGPLAERMVAVDPLFLDLAADGANVLARQLARITRPAMLFGVMERWLQELIGDIKAPFYQSPGRIENGTGIGLVHAARGALGHWLRIEEGKIAHYQIITPTAWNGSPRDENGCRGPWEQALIGVQVKNPDDPVEIGHVVRSFDPCLVCTVHRVGRKEPWLRL
jgi:uptake hydrogenase large subunit